MIRSQGDLPCLGRLPFASLLHQHLMAVYFHSIGVVRSCCCKDKIASALGWQEGARPADTLSCWRCGCPHFKLPVIDVAYEISCRCSAEVLVRIGFHPQSRLAFRCGKVGFLKDRIGCRQAACVEHLDLAGKLIAESSEKTRSSKGRCEGTTTPTGNRRMSIRSYNGNCLYSVDLQW